jgi:hypothetical protein
VAGPSTSPIGNDAGFSCNPISAVFDATEGAGNYTITIFGKDTAVGAYVLTFNDVSTPSKADAVPAIAVSCGIAFISPTISPTESVHAVTTDSCPTWQGAIEVAGERDQFIIPLAAGQRLSLTADKTDNCGGLLLDVTGPSTSPIGSTVGFSCNAQSVVVDATEGPGNYTITLSGKDTAVGSYVLTFSPV